MFKFKMFKTFNNKINRMNIQIDLKNKKLRIKIIRGIGQFLLQI